MVSLLFKICSRGGEMFARWHWPSTVITARLLSDAPLPTVFTMSRFRNCLFSLAGYDKFPIWVSYSGNGLYFFFIF